MGNLDWQSTSHLCLPNHLTLLQITVQLTLATGGNASAPFPLVLDMPPPFSSATRFVRAIPCTTAVLFLLFFHKRYFVSSAKPIFASFRICEYFFFKKKESISSNIVRIMKDTSSIRHWEVRGEDLQSPILWLFCF